MALFLVDIDGVVYLGKRALPGAVPALNALQERGHSLYFITNNSFTQRDYYVRRLGRMGLACRERQVVSSAYATVQYLRRRLPAGSRVFTIGKPGLRAALRQSGLRVVDAGRAKPGDLKGCRALVAALDPRFSYRMISLAQRLLRDPKVLFVATSRDSSMPTEHGLLPGTGPIAAALEAASERRLDAVLGKPERTLYDEVLRQEG